MAFLETDRRDFKLDRVTWDLVIENGDFAFVTGNEAIGQEVRFTLLLLKGEWFWDLNAGTPWFQSVLGQKYEANTLRDLFYNTVIGIEGVQKIEALTLTFDAGRRHLTVQYVFTTIFGGTVTDEVTFGVAA